MSMDQGDSGSTPGVGEAQYRIPKVAVAAELTIEGGRQLAGKVYLAPVANVHGGRERILDLLCSPEHHFLPLALDDGPVRIVHQTRIVLARVTALEDAGLEIDPADPGVAVTDAPEIAVALELAGLPPEISRLTGSMRIEMPPGQQRVVDYLNQDTPFFPLRTAAGMVLVNKEYVLDLQQL